MNCNCKYIINVKGINRNMMQQHDESGALAKPGKWASFASKRCRVSKIWLGNHPIDGSIRSRRLSCFGTMFLVSGCIESTQASAADD